MPLLLSPDLGLYRRKPEISAQVKGWWRKGPRFDQRFAEIRSLGSGDALELRVWALFGSACWSPGQSCSSSEYADLGDSL